MMWIQGIVFISVTLCYAQDLGLSSHNVTISRFRRQTSNSYCDRSCRVGNTNYRHTMCQYGPSCSLQGACAQSQQQPFTKNQKAHLLRLHNDFRNKVATGNEPRLKGMTASRMHRLRWDNELAKIAQCWANQCSTTVHDRCRNRQNGEQVGQNMGALTITGAAESSVYTKSAMNSATSGWFSEINILNPKLIDRFVFDTSIGHVSQVLWGDTKAVGCGRVVYRQGKSYTMKIYCNYGPTGNWENKPVYSRGPVASKCNKRSQTWPGLCV